MCGRTRRRGWTRSRVSCRTRPTVTRRRPDSRAAACGCCGGSRCTSTTPPASALTSRARPGAVVSAPGGPNGAPTCGPATCTAWGRSGSGCTWTGRAGRPQFCPTASTSSGVCRRTGGEYVPTCATPRHRPTPGSCRGRCAPRTSTCSTTSTTRRTGLRSRKRSHAAASRGWSRAEIEFRGPVHRHDPVEVATVDTTDGFATWCRVGGDVRASTLVACAS